jgi:hypothetical protein
MVFWWASVCTRAEQGALPALAKAAAADVKGACLAELVQKQSAVLQVLHISLIPQGMRAASAVT